MRRDSFWFPFEPNRWLSNEKLGMVSLEARGFGFISYALSIKPTPRANFLSGATFRLLSRSAGALEMIAELP